ncbi:phosphotransferase, partial [Arthrobacter sp. JCM 19049]|uniref:phosphotransferase n=1 Tax=Arthrobacter sp. JCM 19049 TaxID=1460643 RepID=UPI000B0F0B79
AQHHRAPRRHRYRFAALVDFGDLCAGDPASDLGMLWLHFGSTARTRALERYGVSDGEDLWHRARGWALRYGLLLCQLDPGDPLGRIGRESLDLLLSAGR